MSYMHVHAVNQQFPGIRGTGQFLVLTKFAELLPANSAQFVWRVGMERFVAMTRLSKGAVRIALKSLTEMGVLVPLDPPTKQRQGMRPVRWKLVFNEGYDEARVLNRLGKWYAGMEYQPQYKENNDDEMREDGTRSLPPVVARDASDTDALPHAKGDSAPVRTNSALTRTNSVPIRTNSVLTRTNSVPIRTESAPYYIDTYNKTTKPNIERGHGGDEVEVDVFLEEMAPASGDDQNVFAKMGLHYRRSRTRGIFSRTRGF